MWQRAIADYDASPAPGTEIKDFHIRTTAWLLGDIAVTAGTLSPVRMVRSAERARGDGRNHYSLLLLTSGSWSGNVDGVTLTVGPGQVVVFDLTRPLDTVGTRNEHITLVIARAALQRIAPRLPHLHGRVLAGTTGRIVADHLLALVRSLPAATASDAPVIARVTSFLLAECFASLSPAGDGDVSGSSDLQHRIRRYIDEHLGSSRLSPEAICRNLAVSRSTLYREFKGLGGVAAYIKVRRLEAAHSRLAHAARSETVASVAYSLGFTSDAHFSKAFRRRFGFAPGETRRRAEQVLVEQKEEMRSETVAERYRNWVKRLVER